MNNVIDSGRNYRGMKTAVKGESLYDVLLAYCEKIVAFTERKSVDLTLRVISGVASFIGGYFYILNVVNGNVRLPAAVIIGILLVCTGGFTVRCRNQ